MKLETIIGLEVHVQLKTKSKMFCRCDNRDAQEPNSAICPICTGQPGTLPLPNEQAIRWAVMTALALGCKINQESKFDRKNYFYPDLPKGYQISQYDRPFGYEGTITVSVNGPDKTFRIHRLHLEEDAGKLLHPAGQNYSLVDLNRAGTPLMEIVSEPDFRTPHEAKAYLQEMQLIMRYLDVSDADMEKGHLRCDANISLRPVGHTELYPKTEIKNLNSFKAVEKALEFEIKRQSGLWEDGKHPDTGATRGWDENTGTTKEQRAKEEAADYRYFPEPDIPPVIISDELALELKGLIPELPAARRARFVAQYSLVETDAMSLVNEKSTAEYFEEVISEFRRYFDDAKKNDSGTWDQEKPAAAKQIANFLLNKVSSGDRSLESFPVPAQDTGRLLWMVATGLTSGTAAVQQIYPQMVATGKGPHLLIKELGLEQVSDSGELEKIVEEVIVANPKVVADVKAGKAAAYQFLVGQVMKATKGKANPQVVQELFKKTLG